MKLRTYDHIANLCVATAILSAILFDEFPRLKIFFGVIGLCAGIVATATYFYHHWGMASAST